MDFLRGLAPETRRGIKKALAALASGKGDLRQLESPLSGYWRLRLGRYRVIFRYVESGDIEAVFAEERRLVYEVFEEEFIQKLRHRLGGRARRKR